MNAPADGSFALPLPAAEPKAALRPVRSASAAGAMLQAVTLAGTDGALLAAALTLGRHLFGLPVSDQLYRSFQARVWLAPLVLAALGAYPGYAVHPARKLRLRVLTVAVAFLALLADLAVWHPEALGAVPAFAACHLAAMVLWPVGSRLAEGWLQRRGWWGTPVAVLGTGREAGALIRTLRAEPALGLVPAGCFDDGWSQPGTRLEGVPVLGPLAAAPRAAAWTRIALVACPDLARADLARLVANLPIRRVLVVPDMDGIQSMWLRGADLGGRFALDLRRQQLVRRNRLLKRALDLGAGALLAAACAPLVLALAALVRLASPGPAFYSQVREGQDGRRFRVWKLRTMHRDAQERLDRHLAASPAARAEWEQHFKLREDPRILPGIGQVLRRTSLDELPQLANVLRGEMSLVGPRPFPHYHLAAFGPDFRRLRRSVPPGMTGLWQVSARQGGDLRDQERLDSFYIHNWSFWLDLDLLLRTVAVVVRGTGS